MYRELIFCLCVGSFGALIGLACCDALNLTASLTIMGEMQKVDVMLRRMQWLVDLRLINVSRAPTDPAPAGVCGCQACGGNR